MQDDSRRPEIDIRTGAEFPLLVRVAGIVWITFGTLMFLELGLILVVSFVIGAATNQASTIGSGLCAGACVGVFGLAFLFVGVQTVRGTAADTLGNGIGSIGFGLLALGGGGFQLLGNPLMGGINLLCGTGLIGAGVLALIGRSDYKAWRQAMNVRR